MKKTAYAAILTLALLFSTVVVASFRAQIDVSAEITSGSNPTLVNQPVEFTVTVKGGTPPYGYQWFTGLYIEEEWPKVEDKPVPGATSQVFEFFESNPGKYFISVNVTDSAGNFVYAWFPPAGVYVTVLESPTPAPTLAPTPTPAATPEPEPFPTTLLIGSTIAVAAVVGLGLLVYLKKRRR